jgi:hypothetical protein
MFFNRAIRRALAARRNNTWPAPWPPPWRYTPTGPRRWPLTVRIIMLLAWVTVTYISALAGLCAGLALRIIVWG